MNVGDDTRVVGDVDPYGMRGMNVGDDTRVVGDVDPYEIEGNGRRTTAFVL